MAASFVVARGTNVLSEMTLVLSQAALCGAYGLVVFPNLAELCCDSYVGISRDFLDARELVPASWHSPRQTEIPLMPLSPGTRRQSHVHWE